MFEHLCRSVHVCHASYKYAAFTMKHWTLIAISVCNAETLITMKMSFELVVICLLSHEWCLLCSALRPEALHYYLHIFQWHASVLWDIDELKRRSKSWLTTEITSFHILCIIPSVVKSHSALTVIMPKWWYQVVEVVVASWQPHIRATIMCYYHATESFPHQQHAPSGTTTIVYDKIWWFQCWITAKRRCAVHPELQCSQSFIAVTILQSVHETSTITDHISSIILISKLSSRNIFHHSCSCLARTNQPSTSLLTGQRLLTKHGIAFTSRTTSSHDQVAVDR